MKREMEKLPLASIEAYYHLENAHMHACTNKHEKKFLFEPLRSSSNLLFFLFILKLPGVGVGAVLCVCIFFALFLDFEDWDGRLSHGPVGSLSILT